MVLVVRGLDEVLQRSRVHPPPLTRPDSVTLIGCREQYLRGV
jgi:hypothetical protein